MDIKLELDENNNGAFNLYNSDKKIGEMVINIADGVLTVYHTEVLPEAEGLGYAKQLLDTMVAYARSSNLKVIALCPYVHLQFRRHTANFEDIWLKQE